jgi:hypothetical protein
MRFHEEISAITSNWSADRISKRTAIIEFEQVMRGMGMLRETEHLNYEMPDAEFMSLLKRAASMPLESVRLVDETRLRNKNDKEAVLKLHPDWTPAASCAGFCAVCGKSFPSLVMGIGTLVDGVQRQLKLDAPRCERCAQAFLNEYLLRAGAFRPDDKTAPMSLADLQFFQPYEVQMESDDD